MKKLIFITIILFFITATGIAQDSTATAATLTLKECVQRAIVNNVDVKKSEYSSQIDEANFRLAKAQILPFVNSSISQGSNQGRNINPYTNTYINQNVSFASYALGGSLNIFSGLSVENSIKQYRLAFEAGKMDVQQQKDYLTINVILAYLSVLSNQDQLTLAQQQADVSRKQVERLEILNKEGAIAPSAFYDLKGQLATDELNIVSTKNALENAKINLAQLMNVAYREDIVLDRGGNNVTPSEYGGEVNDIYNSAEKNLAIVKAADFHRLSALKGIKAAKGLLYPRININGGLGTNYSSTGTLQQFVSSSDVPSSNYVIINNEKVPVYTPSPVYTSSKISYGDQWKNNFNSYVNIGVSIPILNGLQTRNRIQQAQITADQSTFVEQTIKTQLRQSIEQAYINNKSAYQRYQLLNQQVADFAESFIAAQIKFEAGVLTSVEFLVVKTNLDRSRLNLISAQYDYILRSKILDYYQSKPLW